MRIIKKHFGDLRDHARLVSGGMSPEHASLLLFGENPPKVNISDAIKSYVDIDSKTVDVAITTLLNLCTADTLDKISNHHKEVLWSNPEDDSTMKMVGISMLSNFDKWVFDFEDSILGTTQFTYGLRELDLNDKISFLEVVEFYM